MGSGISLSRGATLAGAVFLLAGVQACAPKVTRKDFDSEVARIREEMQAGDQQLASRIDQHDQRLDNLEKELQAFREEYNVSMERLKGQLKFNVPVHFEFDRADVRESDQPLLERFAAVMKEHYPNAVITVEGFADPVGSTRYNERLGMRRAESVKAFLVGVGLGDTQLRTVSYGEARNRQVIPGAGGPEEGMENRRVTFVIENVEAQAGEVAAAGM